jgi:hypothetical protein
MPVRLNYDLSCARLRELGFLAYDNHPPMPERCLSMTTASLWVSVFSERYSTTLSICPI